NQVEERRAIGARLQLDNQIAGVVNRDIVEVYLVRLELLLEVVGAAAQLGFHRLVELHGHQQMRPALQVEPELDFGRAESSLEPIGQIDVEARQQDEHRRQHDCAGQVDAREPAAVGEMHVEKGHDQNEQNQDRSETLGLFHYYEAPAITTCRLFWSASCRGSRATRFAIARPAAGRWAQLRA